MSIQKAGESMNSILVYGVKCLYPELQKRMKMQTPTQAIRIMAYGRNILNLLQALLAG